MPSADAIMPPIPPTLAERLGLAQQAKPQPLPAPEAEHLELDGPALAVMCGLPRSGKTFYAQETLGRKYGWVRACPDDIRLALHGQPFIGLTEPYVWAITETMVRALLIGGHKVVLDAANSMRKRRDPWARLAQEFHLPFSIYWIQTPLDICLQRNKGREELLPLAVIERMHRQFEPPTREEGLVFVPFEGGALLQREG